MALPVQKPKRSLRWMVVLGLSAFAAGLLAGPWVHDQTYAFINRAGPKLAARMPRLFGWLGPAAPSATPDVPAAPAPAVAPAAPVGQPRSPVAVAPTVTPVAAPAPAPEPPATRRRASAPVAPHAQPARTVHSQPAAKSVAAAKVQPVKASARKSGRSRDPFETDAEGAGERSGAQPGKAAVAPAAKPAARSSGSLDSLMADVMGDGTGRSKKHDKAIDAMLKDVQKSRPAPAAKREAAPALEPLTSSDIAKAMAGVKTRANACAQRLKQSGIAELKITVGKDGRVTKASVGGKVAGSPLAACIEKAVRATTFRPNSGLRFDYRIEAR